MRLYATISTAALMLASVPTSTASFCGAVKISQLSVDGRTDAPLGLGNPRPTLAWQMIQTRDCPESDDICPADRRTAYEIQATATDDDLQAGHLIWKSGKTEGNEQNVLFGINLTSRDTSDWDRARWIDYPGRNNSQPLPLFVRPFDIPSGKVVADARLYISGVCMHHATVNGEDATDEVLAPGYSNYQLSSDYRTYDVMNALRPSPNAVGVSLGNGPVYVRRNVRNPAVGRNAPYSWWESQLMGNGTLSADVTTGSSNVRLSSVARYNIGGSINIDTSDGEQLGWDKPGTDLKPSAWTSAGIAPAPNLATKLVARAAELIKEQERFTPVSVTSPVPGIWVFDFGQNIVGWPLITLPELPAGVTIKVAPAEGLNANGTVNQASLGPGPRGSDLFNAYTTAGRAGGETWHPRLNYFGMQWVQVIGLPSGFEPGPELVTGIRLQADVPIAGTFTSSNARLNRINKMAHYSFASNLMSVFTDCPGREKLSYPVDYTMPMGAIYRNFHVDGMLRTSMRHLGEGQSVADTPMAGNVALKTPVYDWGYSGRFGDEINWGNAIVFVPSFLHDLYDDTTVGQISHTGDSLVNTKILPFDMSAMEYFFSDDPNLVLLR
ncbi:alpha-L-rhamnosidase [Verticillium alfalfae VaMs.102]|uniref:Alpha-L-rhamnosidase n=1 Tax=Verticillium alfalfae (strain VaMs.102 / ATCC MYA-4576 / FGSC 10136) TaxID=526221 RepID=C9ST06_VERA1|nr:alpha-L-rhamnosidase [Verticillium alfalfae VaMs.102]EEY21921.1 alpha-L-rhamnosidase [Verticillium alfalfae VaMs.102]